MNLVKKGKKFGSFIIFCIFMEANEFIVMQNSDKMQVD